MGIMNLKGLPNEMKQYKNFILYQKVWLEDKGKFTKYPKKAWYSKDLTQKGKEFGYNASTTKPEHWDTYENIIKAYNTGKYDGIGFVLSNTSFCGIDIDNCIIDGRITDKAMKVIQDLNSWCEYSQSKRGIHIIVEASKPHNHCKNTDWDLVEGIKTDLEVYEEGRFFALTGDRVEGTPPNIEKRHNEFNIFCNENFKMKTETNKLVERHAITDLSEKEVLEKCFNAKNGSKFKALYNGDLSQCNNDPSGCDQALCNMIAFFTDDSKIIDSIMRSSALNRSKWNREDYREGTINNALNTVTNTYDKDYGKKNTLNSVKAERVEQETKESNYIISDLENFINEVMDDKNREKPISTGFENLDELLNGGLYSGLYGVGAISSLGKTALVLQIADNVAKAGNDVIFFSLEMGTRELMARSISRNMFELYKNKVANIGTRKILNGEIKEVMTEFNAGIEAYKETAKNLIIKEGNFDTGIDEIIQTIEDHIKKHNKRPVVVIDYLQIVKGREKATDKQNADYVVSELKRMSRNFNIPVIAISSFNRGSYSSPASFESFKESGAIEYGADVLIGLELSILKELDLKDNKKQDNKLQLDRAKGEIPRNIDLVILKNRNGTPNARLSFCFYPINNFFLETGKLFKK